MNYIRKHKKAVLLIAVVVVVLFAFVTWQRKLTMSKSVYDELKEEPRGEAVEKDDFYYSQLTAKEGEDFLFLKEQMENLNGGVLELPQPVNGKEYQRIITALEYEGADNFYGFVDIPMTEDNVYVLYEDKDVFKITEDKISKVILFLSCAEGIHLSGKFAEDGMVSNLEKIQKGLSVNEEEKVAEIEKRQKETEALLEEILQGLPADSGKKEAIDYFLRWLDENMEFVQKAAATTEGMQNMGDMLEKVYDFNHVASLTKKKASALGYAKIFSELCHRAGMESHLVMGSWNGGWGQSEMYIFCAVSIDGQTVYVDASGQKNASLGGKRCLSEKEAKNRMTFADYFEYS